MQQRKRISGFERFNIRTSFNHPIMEGIDVADRPIKIFYHSILH